MVENTSLRLVRVTINRAFHNYLTDGDGDKLMRVVRSDTLRRDIWRACLPEFPGGTVCRTPNRRMIWNIAEDPSDLGWTILVECWGESSPAAEYRLEEKIATAIRKTAQQPLNDLEIIATIYDPEHGNHGTPILR